MKPGFDALHEIPRDITAKRVVFNEGDHYKPDVKSNTHLFSTLPLPTRDMNRLPHKVKVDPNFKDYTGTRRGNFTVIGLLMCKDFDKWVIRCCCGNYEARTTRAIKKVDLKPDMDRCQACVDLERLRHRDFLKENGHYPWQKRKK